MPAAYLAAARRPEVARDLEALAAELSRDIAARGPACWASGRCCNFDAHGHRLYTTALEAAYTLTRLRDQAHDPWHGRPARAPQTDAPTASTLHDAPGSPPSPPRTIEPEAPEPGPRARAVGATSPSTSSSSPLPLAADVALPQLAAHPPSSTSPSTNLAAEGPRHGQAQCPMPDASAIASARSRGGCPFQSANLCSIHDLKPLACRVYFCDRTADAWMTDTAERFHDRVRALHDRHNVPYLYAEWRDLLEMLIAEG